MKQKTLSWYSPLSSIKISVNTPEYHRPPSMPHPVRSDSWVAACCSSSRSLLSFFLFSFCIFLTVLFTSLRSSLFGQYGDQACFFHSGHNPSFFTVFRRVWGAFTQNCRVRSLPNKVDKLMVLTRHQRDYRECSIMVLNETWLTELTPDMDDNLDSFKLRCVC